MYSFVSVLYSALSSIVAVSFPKPKKFMFSIPEKRAPTAPIRLVSLSRHWPR